MLEVIPLLTITPVQDRLDREAEIASHKNYAIKIARAQAELAAQLELNNNLMREIIRLRREKKTRGGPTTAGALPPSAAKG